VNISTLIAKPAKTDFEQSQLSIFDYKKAINCTQGLYIIQHYQQIAVRNMTKPARHTECPKKVETSEYLGKYKFYRSVSDKSCRVYLLILSIWPWIASPRLDQG